VINLEISFPGYSSTLSVIPPPAVLDEAIQGTALYVISWCRRDQQTSI